jgi:hypothetical protein
MSESKKYFIEIIKNEQIFSFEVSNFKVKETDAETNGTLIDDDCDFSVHNYVISISFLIDKKDKLVFESIYLKDEPKTTILFQDYVFNGCILNKLIKPVDEDCLIILFCDHYFNKKAGVFNEKNIKNRTTKENIDHLLNYENLYKNKNLEYFINLAENDENMLKAIEAEINLFVYEKDKFYDKKMDGEIKYL